MAEAGLSNNQSGGGAGGSAFEVRPLIMLVIALLLIASAIYVGLSFYWRTSQPTLQNPALLVVAARAYAHDQQARGKPVPQSVSLQDLINLGYLEAKDVHAFEGLEVTLFPAAPTDNPQSILARVKLRDGTHLAVLADGSVRQSSQ